MQGDTGKRVWRTGSDEASYSSPMLATAVDPVTATLGANPVTVLFAGLTPGLVGLIQFNIQLGAQLSGQPGTTSAASAADSTCLPLIVRVGGATTPAVNVATGPGGCPPSPPATPAIGVTPARLDFGNVMTGQTASMSVTVRNMGNATLTVKSISSSNARFSVSSSSPPFQVAAAGQAAVAVKFAPDAPGPFTGSLTIQSDDPAHSTISVDLAGTGTAPLAPALTLSAASLDFGSVAVGQTKAIPLTLRNTGTATLNVASVNTDNPRFTPMGPPFFPAQIAAGDQATVMVIFAPSVALPYSATITVTSNDPAGAMVTVAAKGLGTGGTPAITFEPASLDFGFVTIGQSKDLTLTVHSSGSSTLVIQEILSPDSTIAFAPLTRTPISIPPGSQAMLIFEFRPMDTTQISAAFNLATNASMFHTVVPVSGGGTLPP